MTAIDKAARRLLATVPPVVGQEEEVVRSVALATALQAVIRAHIMEGRERPQVGETNALVSGLASAVGWLLSNQPPDQWLAAVKYLTDQALLAADGHAAFANRHRGTMQ